MNRNLTVHHDDTVVFYGDSITYHGRDVIYPGHLGGGYVNYVAARLHGRLASPQLKIFNRGISGDRISDLEARLERDVLSLSPSVVSILIGVNDTWLQFMRETPSPIGDFSACYRRVLEKLRTAGVREFVLMEPFLLPINDEQRRMRDDLNFRIAAIRQLSDDFNAVYIPLGEIFAQAALRAPSTYWVPDGIHPAAVTGDGLIADAWMEKVSVQQRT